MKLGLISDIHADYSALVRVLARLEDDHGVDEILCAGDLTGYGSQPDEVIALMRARNITTVRGNHDSPSRTMGEDAATYLRGLPAEWRAERLGWRMVMCHGIPGVNFIGLTPDTLEKPAIRDMIRALNADIVIAGHTHQVLCQRVDETWILNPGAVYAESDEGTTHSYGLLDLSTLTFSVFDHLQPLTHAPMAAYSLG